MNGCGRRRARAGHRQGRYFALGRYLVAAGVLAGAGTGCSLDALTKNDQVPPNISDPAVTETHDGALQVYRGLITLFQSAFSRDVGASARLGDELRYVLFGSNVSIDPIDARILPEGNSAGGNTYSDLQKVRGQANQAIGLLTAYAPDERALTGRAYALEGYAEVMLADLFCSGIPLSTLDYGANYTYRPGSRTVQVYQHAAALFDTAATLAGDSTRFVVLAAVGKARALLGAGDYAGAAAAVAAGVPDDYRYLVSYSAAAASTSNPDSRPWSNFFRVPTTVNGVWEYSVADREGGNGLAYLTSGDPRSAGTPAGRNDRNGTPVYYPTKYVTNGTMDGASPIVLASGVEARLIEAEAALQAGDVSTWLAKLNALRTAGAVTIPFDTLSDTLGVTGCTTSTGHQCGTDGVTGGTFAAPGGYGKADSVWLTPLGPTLQQYCQDNSLYAPCANDSTQINFYVHPDSVAWSAGSGGVAGLAALADPGAALAPAEADTARVNLLFRERAFWLFLTGQRQGDLRRLIRQYDRQSDEVYPIGGYPWGTDVQYGDDVTLPIPSAESLSNPFFHGYLTRDA